MGFNSLKKKLQEQEAKAALVTNGCSGGVSWAWKLLTGKAPGWEYCCDMHDLAYVQGGPREWRSWADAILRDCILERRQSRWYQSVLNCIAAWAVWIGVRAGGGSYWRDGMD